MQSLITLRAANKIIIDAILNTLLKALGVDSRASTMTQYIEDRVMYLNYYPNCPNPQLTFGASRHYDMATLTILVQDDIGGLFFKVEDKEWIEIPPVEGTLVINTGDTLEILSSGRYKSTEHRVTNPNKAMVSSLYLYPLVLTTVFNLGDLVSRYLPLINCLRLTSRMGLMVATLAHFLFIPAFYYMSKYGDQGWMIMLTFILGLTNGYLAVCALMAAPKGYMGPEQNALGHMMQTCLIGGVLAGVTFGWSWLIGKGW